MATDRQIAANRRNGSLGRGPKTSAGKARSSRNALKHGLSIPVNRDKTLRRQIEVLARVLAQSEAGNVFGQARAGRALAVMSHELVWHCSACTIMSHDWTVTGSSGGQRFGRSREVLGAALSAVPFSEWPRRDRFETKRPGARSAGNARSVRCPSSRRGPPTESNCRTGP